jgi:Fe-S oxidoreductase
MAHCTEKTNTPASTALWQPVFEKFGLKLIVVATGCCGMSGTYGHEERNYETSKKIYGLSWQPIVEQHTGSGTLLANGYSCRSQVKRFGGEYINHPIQALLAQMKS